MQREAVLRLLQAHKPELFTTYGVTRLGIFGSVAREQASSSSDVDVVVEMPPDLFLMVHLKAGLEHLPGGSVDLIRLHKHLNPLLKSRIDDDAIYL